MELATNTPIGESPTIDKSLTLRAAAGFTPTLAPLNPILAVSSGSGVFDFVIEGITLQRGPIRVGQRSSGVLTATIRGNVIRMQANSHGAAIEIAKRDGAFTADVIGNTISGTDYDAGIFLFQFTPAGTLTACVINNLITGQNGNVGAAAAIAIDVSQGNGSFTVVNNTAADNRFGLLVAARLDLRATTDGRIANNILAHNADADTVIDSDVEATVTNGFNLAPFSSFTPGLRTIFADPAFAGPGDYHLGLVSPAVNAGNDSDVPADITTDLDGNPRIRAGRVDMGARVVFRNGARLRRMQA